MFHVLTATGARPEAWALCVQWMARQTYAGPVRWIVVDDGPQPQEMPATLPPGWSLELIRPRTLWAPGRNTQLSNLRQGLRAVPRGARLAIVEDDEHYAPGWLERVAGELEQQEQVGQKTCRKYNLRTRRALELRHPWRASLCATAVRGQALERLRRLVGCGPAIIDGVLWKQGLGRLFDGVYVTGIKCMPGRPGIDSGHRDNFGDRADPDLALLRAWLGDDAQQYEDLMKTLPTPSKAATTPTRAGEIAEYAKQYRAPNYRMGLRRQTDVQAILRKLAPGSLLDVGTGRGETLHYAKRAGMLEVVGTEVVPALLRDRDVVYAEAHALPFADGAWDHVTCFDVLEHLTEPDIRPALREMRRVARRTCTVSASERSDIRAGRELHISKRPASAWLELIREEWGPDAGIIGTAGASPAYQVKIA